MARKIGDVTIEGDYDGDLALRQARKNVKDLEKVLDDGAKKAGKKSGKSWGEEFSQSMRDRMSDVQMPFFDRMADKAGKQGNKSGRLFSNHFGTVMTKNIKGSVDDSIADLARLGEPGGLEKLAKRLGSVKAATDRFKVALRDAAGAGAIQEVQANRLTDSVNRQEAALRKALTTQKLAVGAVYDRAKAEEHAAKMLRNAMRAGDENTAALERERLERIGGSDALVRHGINMEKFTKQMRDQKLTLSDSALALGKHGFAMDDNGKKTRSLSSLWKGMSHNGRQWTLIIGAIAAALPTLSVLGSAAGGALAAVGNSAVTLIASIGLAIVGFQGLFGETVTLTAGAEASKVAFQNLGQAFKDLQPGIVNAMFDSMAASIENLTAKLIPGIADNLYALSGAIGDAMATLLDMFASPAALSIFNGLLEDATKAVGPLLEGLGGLFLGVLAIFDQAGPLAQSFAEWIKEIGTNFLTWTQDEGGRARIAEWLETAGRIIPLVGELIVAMGQALADLVTPATIQYTEDFLTNITEFMGPLSGLLGILGELDVFGVLASLLNSVGQALAPLQEPMSQLATLIGTTLKSAIDTLGPAFAALGGFLGPIISAVVDFLTPIFERLANEVLPVLVAAWGEIMTALAPVGAAISSLLEAMQPIVSFLIDVLLNTFNLVWPAIMFVVQMVIDVITGLINGLINIFNGITMVVENWGTDWDAVWQGVWLVIQGVVEFIWNLISVTLIGKAFGLAKTGLTALGNFFTTIWTSIRTFVTTAINGVKTVITNVMTNIKSFWNTTLTGIKTIATNIWNAISKFISTVFNAIKKTITNILNGIKSIWNSVWTWIQTTVTNIWNGIKNGISTAIEAVRNTISNILGLIKAIWEMGWNNLKNTASNVWSAIKSAIKTAIDAVKSVIDNVMNAIKGIWENIWNGLKGTVESVWNGIKWAIQGPIDAIKGFINSLKGPIDAAIGWFNSLFGSADSAQGKASSAANSGGGGPRMAAGGILRRATIVTAGEAGDEAIVPLNRRLSQVSPDVRWISAIAQGKATMAQGAATGRGEIIFQPGSIVVQGATDPRRTAYEVANVVAERIAS